MNEPCPTLLSEIKSRHEVVRSKVARLDEVLQELDAGAPNREPQTALSELAAFFTRDLYQLISLEEEVIFPPLDRSLHQIGGPVAALRLEHEELMRLAEAFGAAVAALQRHGMTTTQTLQQCAKRLSSLLLLHLEKEDTVLFHLAQKVLTNDDWAEAAERARLWEIEIQDPHLKVIHRLQSATRH